MSLVVSSKLNGHDPWAYLKDVLTRLPMHPNNRIDELLPHRWKPQAWRPSTGRVRPMRVVKVACPGAYSSCLGRDVQMQKASFTAGFSAAAAHQAQRRQ